MSEELRKRIEKVADMVEGDPADGNLKHEEVVEVITNLVSSELATLEATVRENLAKEVEETVLTCEEQICGCKEIKEHILSLIRAK